MKAASGKTEEETFNIIQYVVNVVSPSFKFGIYDIEDIKQEAFVYALESLDKYDGGRPLDSFLYVVLKHKLLNLIRNKFSRSDPPCLLCHNHEDKFTEHVDGRYCQKYRVWLKRNVNKRNLMNPLDIMNIDDENEPTMRNVNNPDESVILQELFNLIDEKLPVEYRSIYLQMRDGAKVPKVQRDKVESIVRQIIKEENLDKT